MSKKRGGGFKPPGNFEPNRSKSATKRGIGVGATARKHAERSQAARELDPKQKPDLSTQKRNKYAGQQRAAGAAATQQPVLSALVTLPARFDAVQTRPADVTDATFASLGLGGNIVRALGELGAEKPFPIQAATIPDILTGYHVLGRGRTGSGKTIAFGSALVERVLRLKAEGVFGVEAPREKPQRGVHQGKASRTASKIPKAIILAPTRELALQIDRTVQPIARSVGLYTGQFVGGQPFEPQLDAISRGIDIVIGTPGRIEDLAKRGHLRLGQVAITVIDEADHMADLGFIEPVRRVLKLTRRGGQRLLFSATLDRGVDELVREFMPKPAVHEVLEHGEEVTDGQGASEASGVPDWKPAANVEHRVGIVLREHKNDAIIELAGAGGRTIVFCRTRAYADQVVELLAAAEIESLALHGDLSQARRERNLEKFSAGNVNILVATDVAARGIHVDDVDLVLQVDPPNDPKAYVHRAGRTGRVGKEGRVMTLIPRNRQKRTRELFEALGFEPTSFEDFLPQVTLRGASE